ncbi:MAG: hypothetical protein KZQ92_01370 [Candidatus Thiodiazotropha sp. (ex Lucinoma borealis)]|nr:hypothetical protein [Candidatus Thiodiazotropha sp. (ex Lucinoma borealis)]
MKSLYLRSITVIIPIIFIWHFMATWLVTYTDQDEMEYIPDTNIVLAREMLKQQIGQDDEIDYTRIKQIASEFEITITVFNSSDYFLGELELAELKSTGFIETFDSHNNYGQLILLRDPDLLLELVDDPSLRERQDILIDIIALLLLVLLSVIGLHFAVRPFDHQLKEILATLSQLNSNGQAQKLNNMQSGAPGEIARGLDVLSDNMNQIVESRSDLLVAHQDLLHGVAHEFRSPMARLNFAIEMLISATSDEDTASLYEDICIALEEMDQLVAEVLQYSRLQHGDEATEFKSISMIELVRSVISKQKIITPQVIFNTEGQDASIRVIGHLFERAIVNLVRNASRFARQQVLISWQLIDGKLQLKVADDGIGIPPGKREHIFEPFTRLDPSRSRESGGIGLGLSITKSICTKHHGTIVAGESSLGGAEFCIRIPVA